MATKEEWRPVATTPGYEVSNLGKIRSWRRPGGNAGSLPRLTPKILKLQCYKDGYYGVTLRRKGICINIRPHRKVLEAFIGPCPPGMEASHLNGNRLDNRLCNLVWETPLENQRRRRVHGTWQEGESSHASKLSEEQVLEIRGMLAEGKMSQSQIAGRFGIRQATVSDIKIGKTWKHLQECKI